jgi:hypothetical protein
MDTLPAPRMRTDIPQPARPAIDRWHVITPFKVKSFGAFFRAADAAGLDGLFKRNPAGFVYCIDPRLGDERPELERLYKLLQEHLPPREYALLRIEHAGAGQFDKEMDAVVYDAGHTRYEKVFRDRIEPTVYSDDPYRRR